MNGEQSQNPTNIVIVAKSAHGKKAQHIELVGIDWATGAIVRVVEPLSSPPPNLEDFGIGEIWALESKAAPQSAPRTETIKVEKARWIGEEKHLRRFVQSRVTVWNGGLSSIFSGCLRFTKNSPSPGTAFVSRNGKIPQVSLGFWMPDSDLRLLTNCEHPNCVIGTTLQDIRIPYHGNVEPVQEVPAGSLLCMSLLPWWKPSGPLEERSHLYICGYYCN